MCIALSQTYQVPSSNKDIVFIKDVSKKSPRLHKNSKKHRSEKIVGGVDASEHVAPWMVSLQFGTRVKIHFCGGTIIASDWILTAGHCLQNKNIRLEVYAGRHDLKKNESETEQKREIWRTFIHPQFKGGVGNNDIALIQLKEPLIYTSSVDQLNLPDKSTSEEGEAVLYGWGSTSRTRFPISPNVLQTMTAPIISNAQCKKQVLNYGSIVRDSNICTGKYDFSSDITCETYKSFGTDNKIKQFEYI